jgi:ubiquinone biosynthesis protein
VKRLPILVFVLSTPVLSAAQSAEPVGLPTPLSHHQSYDWQADARALAMEVGAALPESTRNQALSLLAEEGRKLDEAEIRSLLMAIEWSRYRPRISRILLHGSQVLDVVPEEAAAWRPLIHDALLLFLDGLSEDRFIERIATQAMLPRDASRGDRVLGFVVNVPSLQKLAQILARNPSLAPDLRLALQTLENGIHSARYDDIMDEIRAELDPGVVREYEIVFRERLLAEASVGAVVEARYRPRGSQRIERAACKVLKRRAVDALAEDLVIIDDVLEFLERHGDFYDIGATPLVDIFEEIREALSREVRVSDERENLERAGAYYRGSSRIQIPEVLAFSTPNVTCMEFIEGVKITDAFPGRRDDRARLARRLSDALTFDVLFSRSDRALFHGDPHAGNVFHVTSAGSDPFRIALIDWGLKGEFDRSEREKLVQVMLGLHLRDGKRLTNNADVLVDLYPESELEREALRPFLETLISESGSGGMFPLMDDLLTGLAKRGFKVRYEAAMFIKSQLTISGILEELDPGFEQDHYVMGRISGLVFRETGPRLLRTVWFPAWNSHDYRSLMSNEDVKDVQLRRTGRFFKKVGKGIWIGVSFQWLF